MNFKLKFSLANKWQINFIPEYGISMILHFAYMI